jgi:hypothetical protein
MGAKLQMALGLRGSSSKLPKISELAFSFENFRSSWRLLSTVTGFLKKIPLSTEADRG